MVDKMQRNGITAQVKDEALIAEAQDAASGNTPATPAGSSADEAADRVIAKLRELGLLDPKPLT
jgi:hypothetical protein